MRHWWLGNDNHDVDNGTDVDDQGITDSFDLNNDDFNWDIDEEFDEDNNIYGVMMTMTLIWKMMMNNDIDPDNNNDDKDENAG